MSKRASYLLILVLLLIGIAGCGEEVTSASEAPPEPPLSTTPLEPVATTATSIETTTTTEAPTTTSLSDFYRRYEGEGNKILDLGTGPGDVFILHLVTDSKADVKPFDGSGQQTYGDGDFSIPDKGSYDGRILAAPETSRLQINSNGRWTIDVQPMSAAVELNAPSTITGTSDEIVRLTGSPSSLSITGNPTGKFSNFFVHYYAEGSGWPEHLVNELGNKYEGVAIVAGDGYLVVTAEFDWSITSEP